MKAFADPFFRIRRTAFAALGASLLAAGCATTEVRSQWSDPAFANHSLKGARVLVVCEAQEISVRRNCQEQLALQVRQLGATPVFGADTLRAGPGGATESLLAAARGAGTAAVLSAQLMPETTVVGNSGPSVSLGIGGFGWGGGRSSVGGGVGVSVPVGGGDTQVSTAYSANCALSHSASGRLMWAAKLVAPDSSSLNTQVQALGTKLGEELQKAALF